MKNEYIYFAFRLLSPVRLFWIGVTGLVVTASAFFHLAGDRKNIQPASAEIHGE